MSRLRCARRSHPRISAPLSAPTLSTPSLVRAGVVE